MHFDLSLSICKSSADSGVINVQFGPHNLNGYIDRRNNNGYPRIQVGSELRYWVTRLPGIRISLHLTFSNNHLTIR